MYTEEIRRLLEQVKGGDIDIAHAIEVLKELPYTELGHTRIDNHRNLRTGYPEVIYGAGKSRQQIIDIVSAMLPKKTDILITRTTSDVYEAILQVTPLARFHETARVITIRQREPVIPTTYIAIVTAGTSDMPVAEEAAVVAEFMGNRVERTFDVGVAGLHRVVDRLHVIRQARVIIVVAGMEGALASVIGGLVDKPVIAVPTSVGYGASFGGISALLCMLTSCASGISVVNIDNGFGAAFMASMINKL